MTRTSHAGLVFAAALLVAGCGGAANDTAQDQPADSAAMAAPAPAGDASGTWDMRATPAEGTDTTSTIFQVQVAGDSWTLLLPGRDPIPARVTTGGDSIIVDAGPYESVRRPGTQVSTHSVYRMSGDQLTGTTVAHYQSAGKDSVLNLISTGTRVK
jgi:hypothetical protein